MGILGIFSSSWYLFEELLENILAKSIFEKQNWLRAIEAAHGKIFIMVKILNHTEYEL